MELLHPREFPCPFHHVRTQGKSFHYEAGVYAPTRNAKEAEIEWFYEGLQDLLELTTKKDVLFIIGDCNSKIVEIKKHLE